MSVLRCTLGAATVLVSASAIHLSRENLRLKSQLASIVRSETGYAGCRLPGIAGNDLKGNPWALTFPRTRAILMLSADRSCPFCEISWPYWKSLARRLPEHVEPIVLDIRRTMNAEYSRRVGAGPEFVVQPETVPPEITEFTSRTPTVMLISRHGLVLGRWTGKISEQKVGSILASIDDNFNF